MAKTAKSVEKQFRDARLKAEYLKALVALEYIILATSTGPIRNLVTEANLKVMEAEELVLRQSMK